MISNRLPRIQAAEYLRETHGLRCSPAYLEKLGSLGGGPLFYRVGGRVEYDPIHLDDWATSRISGPLSKASGQSSPKAA
jgi:hypothetical protein